MAHLQVFYIVANIKIFPVYSLKKISVSEPTQFRPILAKGQVHLLMNE